MAGELRIENWTMPVADLGPENPLPPLRAVRELHAVEDTTGLPDEMVKNLAYGGHPPPNILPYTMQDRYTRERRLRDFRVAVLENEFLCAAFLLELGRRLWSLVHKPSARELGRQSRLSAGQSGHPQRVVQRRGGVEHWHHWPLSVYLFAAVCRARRGAGRGAAPADVRVGAGSAGSFSG